MLQTSPNLLTRWRGHNITCENLVLLKPTMNLNVETFHATSLQGF